MTKKPNKKAFSELIEKNQAIIHKVCMIYANGRANREDLFQEICLQLWRSYPTFREDAKFSTWMYRVAINTAISNTRKEHRKPPFEPLHDTENINDEQEDKIERIKQLYGAIAKLNYIDKAIILLWLNEKSYEEIAAIMGITKTNVSVKLVRIKQKLEKLVLKTEMNCT